MGAGRHAQRQGGDGSRRLARIPDPRRAGTVPGCHGLAQFARAGGLRRPVLGGVAPLPVPARGRPRRIRPAAAARHHDHPSGARRECDGRRRPDADRPARLRRVLQAARGGHDDPHTAGLPVDAGSGRRARRRGEGRRVLPQHGARARGRLRGRGGGAPRGRRPGAAARRAHPHQCVQGARRARAHAHRGGLPGGRAAGRARRADPQPPRQRRRLTRIRRWSLSLSKGPRVPGRFDKLSDRGSDPPVVPEPVEGTARARIRIRPWSLSLSKGPRVRPDPDPPLVPEPVEGTSRARTRIRIPTSDELRLLLRKATARASTVVACGSSPTTCASTGRRMSSTTSSTRTTRMCCACRRATRRRCRSAPGIWCSRTPRSAIGWVSRSTTARTGSASSTWRPSR
ncbi:hypothetical protein MICRO8M_50090 [Microbacterium sp. 8M]|nr:hypothetical protein MICRO8M_50090 [Microbacterium sp. 8M]